MKDWKNETGDLRPDNNDTLFFCLIKEFEIYTVGKIGYFEEVLRNIKNIKKYISIYIHIYFYIHIYIDIHTYIHIYMDFFYVKRLEIDKN